MKKELSPTMRKAVALAKKNGGKLSRYPGGYWAGADFSLRRDIQGRFMPNEDYFGASTVHALFLRGVAEYTDHKEGRGGRFPIEITLIATQGAESE